MPKFYDDPAITVPRLNEDVWFEVHKELLLAIANTKFGRDLLCIPQEYPTLTKFKKNCIHWENPDGTFGADFRIGAKWANVIRYKWEQFNSYARYFSFPRILLSTMELKVPMSTLLKFARTMTMGTLTAYPDPNPESTSVDGYAQRSGVIESISTIVASAGTSFDDSSTSFNTSGGRNSGSPSTSSWTVISRAITMFDTSSLTVNVAVSAATYSVWPTGGSGSTRDVEFVNAHLYIGTETTALQNSSYNSSNWNGSCSTEASYTAMGNGAYHDFTLNAGGIAQVSLTGLSRYGLRTRENNGGTVTSPGFTATMTYSSADNTGTSQDPKLVVTYTSAPNPPSALTATSYDASVNIDLAWTDNSSNEDSFLVERSTSPSSGFSQIATKTPNTVAHTDSTGSFDTLYYYRVRAHLNSPSLNSTYSNTASAQTAPATPTTLADTSTPGHVVLTWVDVSTSLTKMSVERKVNSGAFVEIAQVNPGVQTYDDSTVVDLNTYTYRIRAFRNSDTRYSSYTSNLVVQPALNPPYNLIASPVTADTKIDLSWVDASQSESNYEVYRSNDNVTFTLLNTIGSNLQSYEDSIGTSDTLKYYKIRAKRVSDSAFSTYSSVVSGTTAPAAPSSLSLSRSATAIDLSWTNNSSTQTEVRVDRAVGDGAFQQIGVTSGHSFEDTDILTSLTYHYRVRAYRSNDEMFSAYSATSDSAGTGAVSDLSIFGGSYIESLTNGSNTIQLMWKSTNPLDEAYIIEKFDVDDWDVLATVSLSENSYLDTGLNAATTYQYRVSNVVNGITETTSDAISVSTRKGTPGDLNIAFLHKTRNFPS